MRRGRRRRRRRHRRPQRGQARDLDHLRGGYNEDWTVFWITAHFFTGAARFAELGVEVWK